MTSRRADRPVELYFWPTPNGWKVSILLEELGIPYTIKKVNIGIGDQFKPSFLKISPNNRMPALVDPDGPGGKPISIFESGAILQYLATKYGRFYPKTVRGKTDVDQWLFWQMGGLGPMAGQAHHFLGYAPSVTKKDLSYGQKRYRDEVNRLYGVLNKQLKGKDYVCGSYSIADMAIWPWIVPYKRQKQDLNDFPHLKKWFERMQARPAVQRGFAVNLELRNQPLTKAEERQRARVLFGQKAR